jgi:hypothetical protein
VGPNRIYRRSGAMICGVPVDGDTGTVPGGDAVDPVVVRVVVDPVGSTSPFDPVVSLPELLVFG